MGPAGFHNSGAFSFLIVFDHRMNQAIAILISISLATPDGGLVLDRPYADADAGVYQVDSAQLPRDGGTLGPGWYLTDARITKVGEHLAQCQEPGQQPQPQSNTTAVLVIAGLSMLVGAGVALYIEGKIAHR